MGNPRMLTVFSLVLAIVLGVAVSLATNSWWFLALALVAHAAGSAFVLVFIGKRLEQGDKPDPVTEAHREAGDDRPADRHDGLTDSGRRGDREVVL